MPQQNKGRAARGTGLVARQQTVATDEKWRHMRRRRAFELPQPSTGGSQARNINFESVVDLLVLMVSGQRLQGN